MLIFYSDWVILCLYSSTWFSAGWQWHLTSSSSCQLDNAAWPCDAARPAFIIFINSDASGGRLTLIWRRHSFTPYVMSRVDYSNAILAAALKTTTDRLQRVLNAAARVVSDTKKSDQGLSRLMHQELHWLDISERVNYKLGVLTHRCLLGKAPVYLSNSQTAAFQSVKSLHGGIYAPLHVISWPYLDIVSALNVGGHLLSLVQRCLTLCLMIYEILQSAHQPSDSCWSHFFSLPISTFSALGVSHIMRSINVRYLLI